MQDQHEGGGLPLQSFTKDVPPGWRPYSYPLPRYRDLLHVWMKLTKLDSDQIGAAMISRLGGTAYDLAMSLQVTRREIHNGTVQDRTYVGVEAACLDSADAVMHPTTGAQVAPAYPPGCKMLLDHLFSMHYLDDQDRAWVSLDAFFSFRQGTNQDFLEYTQEWDRLLKEATDYGGLQLSDPCKAYIFFSQSNLDERTVYDLRLKVNGDLNRFREMIQLQIRLTKNDAAINDQSRGYRRFISRPSDHFALDDDYEVDEYGYWGEEDTEEDWYDDEPDWYYMDGEEEQYWLDNCDYDQYYEKGKGKKGKGKWKGQGKYDRPLSSTGAPSSKGKGKQPVGNQCTVCGSKFHSPQDCPLAEDNEAHHVAPDAAPQSAEDYDHYNDEAEYYGKGYGQNRGSFGRTPWRPRWSSSRTSSRKGKGKGRSKGKGKKGKGKGKRRHYFVSEESYQDYALLQHPTGQHELPTLALMVHGDISDSEFPDPPDDDEQAFNTDNPYWHVEDHDRSSDTQPAQGSPTKKAKRQAFIGSIFGPTAHPLSSNSSPTTASLPVEDSSFATSVQQTTSEGHFQMPLPRTRTPQQHLEQHSSTAVPSSGDNRRSTMTGYFATPAQVKILGKLPDSFLPDNWCATCRTPLTTSTTSACMECNSSFCLSCIQSHTCGTSTISDSWSVVSTVRHGTTPASTPDATLEASGNMPTAAAAADSAESKQQTHNVAVNSQTPASSSAATEETLLSAPATLPQGTSGDHSGDAYDAPQFGPHRQHHRGTKPGVSDTPVSRACLQPRDMPPVALDTTTTTTSTTNPRQDQSFGNHRFEDEKPMMVTRHGVRETAIAHAPARTAQQTSAGATDTQASANTAAAEAPAAKKESVPTFVEFAQEPDELLRGTLATGLAGNDAFAIYQTIGGVQTAGLLIDPGASRGLIGYECFKVILRDILRPHHLEKEVQWKNSSASFTGISSTTEKSKGQVTFPVGLNLIGKSTFTADTITGGCPALVPLISLRKAKSIMLCDIFPDGTGLLLLHHSSQRGPLLAPQRLLLTDSGHYLLQIHFFRYHDKELMKNVGYLMKQLQPLRSLVAHRATELLATSEPEHYKCLVLRHEEGTTDEESRLLGLTHNVFQAVLSKTVKGCPLPQ